MPLTAGRAQLAAPYVHNHGPHSADGASGGLGGPPAVPGRARVHLSSFPSTSLRCNIQAQQTGSQLPASHPISASSSFGGSTAGSSATSAATSTDGRAAAGGTLLQQQQQQQQQQHRTCTAGSSSSGGGSTSSLPSQHSRSSGGALLAPRLATSSSSGRSSSSSGGGSSGALAAHTALRTAHTDASTSYLERLHRQRTNAAEAAAAAVAGGSTALSRTQAALQRLQSRSRSAPGLGTSSSSSSSSAGMPKHMSDSGLPSGLSYLQRPALAAGRPSSLGAGSTEAAEALLQSNRQQLQERLQALRCGSGAVAPGLGRRYSHEGTAAAEPGSNAPARPGRRCSSAGTAAELASSRLSRLSSSGVLAGARPAEAAAAGPPPAAAPTVRWSSSSYLGVACDPLTACNPLGQQQQQQQAGQHWRSSSLGAVPLETQHRRSSGNGSFHTAATSLRSTPYVSLSGSDGGSSCAPCTQCGSSCCHCSSSVAGAAAPAPDAGVPSSTRATQSAPGGLGRQGSGPPLGSSLNSRGASRQSSFLIGTATDEEADGAGELAQDGGGDVSCQGEAAVQFLTGTFCMSRSNSLSSAAVGAGTQQEQVQQQVQGPRSQSLQQQQQQQQHASRPGMSFYRGHHQRAPSSDDAESSDSDVSSMSTSLEQGYTDSSHSGGSDSDSSGGGDCYAGRSGAAAAARRQLAGRPLGSSFSLSTEGAGSGAGSAAGSSCDSGKDVALLSGASSSSGSSTDSSSLQRQVALAAARAAAGGSGSGTTTSSSTSSAAGGLVAACGRAKLGSGGVPAGCVGLQNLGNTCFMNSILQCLNCLPELVEALLGSKASRRRSRSDRTSGMVWHGKASVGPALCDLLQQMWVGTRSGSSGSSRMAAVSPRAFLHALSRADERWSRGCQQDSQEFLHSLLELLQGECNRVHAKPQYRELSSAGSEAAQAAEAASYARSWHDSTVDDLFGGFLQSTITCSGCGHRSHCFDPFLDLSVPIPKSRAVSLQDCLSAFVEKELLQGSEQVKCGSCGKSCDASKRLQIHSYPRLLVLTLKRFASSGSGRSSGSWLGFSSSSYSKNTAPVTLPGPDVPLDLAPFCSAAGLAVAAAAGRAPPRYELLAVSQHSGSLGGGHYTACGRSIASGSWFDFNDAYVSADHAPSGASSSAYVLFFRLAAAT